MTRDLLTVTPAERVERLKTLYDSPACSVAALLCDGHDPASVAYKIVHADLSVDTMTYDQLRIDSERFASALSSLGNQYSLF